MTDFKSVADILALVADPIASGKRLEELRAANEVQESVKADRSAAEKLRGEARRIADETRTSYEAKLADLNARQNTVAGKERDLADKVSAVVRREGACNNRESDLVTRERTLGASLSALADRERKLEETSQRVAAEESAWNEKLRNATSALNK